MRSTIASPSFAPSRENVRMSQSTASLEPIIQSAGADEPVHQVIARLPPLPSVIRYYDEFDDTARAIRNPADTDKFEVWINGTRTYIDFGRLEKRGDGTLLKHLFTFLLAQDLSIQGINGYIQALSSLTHEDITQIVTAGPTLIGTVWARLRARNLHHLAYPGVKGILRLLCQHRLNGWSNDFRAYLASNLPLPAGDKYASVRTGTAFLSIDEEAAIVRYLDEMASSIASDGAAVPPTQLADACMLLCAFQFAMRPVQIAKLTVRNMRVWKGADDGRPAVHLTFHMAKQKTNTTRRPLTRRIKQEWAQLFLALQAVRQSQNMDGADRLFRVASSKETQERLGKLLNSLLGGNHVATDLRHAAAQRLVDAGANHEELAEFMGHSDVRTGLVYYEASSTQAERVNKALGLSTIYRAVAKIAHDRFISSDELTRLKDDQQIAGVPHGMPISGIGGCTSGQPACPYNPITSCYGCRKFMPVHDKAVHERVLGDFRSVVTLFQQSSRGDVNSPAYLQLQRTINDVKVVIEEVEDDNQ
jgi:integrase